MENSHNPTQSFTRVSRALRALARYPASPVGERCGMIGRVCKVVNSAVLCRSVLAIASDLYAAGSVALWLPLSLKGLYTAPRIVVIADVGPGVGSASWAPLEWRRLAPRSPGDTKRNWRTEAPNPKPETVVPD